MTTNELIDGFTNMNKYDQKSVLKTITNYFHQKRKAERRNMKLTRETQRQGVYGVLLDILVKNNLVNSRHNPTRTGINAITYFVYEGVNFACSISTHSFFLDRRRSRNGKRFPVKLKDTKDCSRLAARVELFLKMKSQKRSSKRESQ